MGVTCGSSVSMGGIRPKAVRAFGRINGKLPKKLPRAPNGVPNARKRFLQILKPCDIGAGRFLLGVWWV